MKSVHHKEGDPRNNELDNLRLVEHQIITFDQPVTCRNGESLTYIYGPDGHLAEILKMPSGEFIPFHVEP